MLEDLSILGTIVGGVFRIIPEVMKVWDKKNERKHELALLDKNMEYDKVKNDLRISELNVQTDMKELEGIIDIAGKQLGGTGVKWVDALNSCIRPFIALQWLILLWPGIICFTFWKHMDLGSSAVEALQYAFGQDEKTFCASIAAFFFVDRSLKSKLFRK